MRKILLLEDDAYLAQSISEMLKERGVECTSFADVHGIDARLRGPAPDALVVDLAIPLNGSKLISNQDAHAGFHSGQAVLRYAKQRWSKTPMALITGNPSNEVRKWCLSNGIEYFLKPVPKSTFDRFIGFRGLRAFVVHGRNLIALQSTKNVLRSLGIKPIILMDCANLGRTIIEKFEEVSSSCDCAIIVVSPDDIGRLRTNANEKEQFRARQNVLFELGYFCGTLGRLSGSVVLIEYGDVEIPSDLCGVVRVNGKVPQASLKKQLRKEFAHILT